MHDNSNNKERLIELKKKHQQDGIEEINSTLKALRNMLSKTPLTQFQKDMIEVAIILPIIEDRLKSFKDDTNNE